MSGIIELETLRLKLRQWRKEDLPAFAALNANPEVMRYYPDVLTPDESNTLANKIRSLIIDRGWGFWAVEKIDEKKFIGFVGLHVPTYNLPFTPCVEIGWRLARASWGSGFATEAAREALAFAFGKLDLAEVYSFASVSNKKSQAVMARLGMIDTLENFQHPVIPVNHPLREHVLYKIDKQGWLGN